jgi:hypothetical protein
VDSTPRKIIEPKSLAEGYALWWGKPPLSRMPLAWKVKDFCCDAMALASRKGPVLV